MIVMALRTEGNHRYSWMKNQRSLFVSRTRPRSLRRNTIQLMSQHRILGFKSALRLEWRDQNAQDETEQRDHRALTLCDSIRQSMRMRFLVHTGAKKDKAWISQARYIRFILRHHIAWLRLSIACRLCRHCHHSSLQRRRFWFSDYPNSDYESLYGRRCGRIRARSFRNCR